MKIKVVRESDVCENGAIETHEKGSEPVRCVRCKLLKVSEVEKSIEALKGIS